MRKFGQLKKKLIFDEEFEFENSPDKSEFDKVENDDKNVSSSTESFDKTVKEKAVKIEAHATSLKENSDDIKDDNPDSQDDGINPNYVWGKLVSNLRERELMTLHTACGEIRNFEMDKKVLTIFVKEEYLYNILTKEENLLKIGLMLDEIYKGIKLKVELIKKPETKINENLQKLKALFAEDLVVS